VIIGQVTDGLGGRPIADAVVQLTMPFNDQGTPVSSNLPTTPRGRVLTDNDGRFFFSDLPPGQYALSAEKFGYTRSFYGARRPGGSLVYYELSEGERGTDATIALWKNAVITGTIVDEAGEPMIGVSVRAAYRSVVTGQTRGVSQGMTGTTTTDDRGVYRLAGLIPGEFAIYVPVTPTTFPVSIAAQSANAPAALRAEIAAAIAETAPLGNPRNQQFGGAVLLTLNSMPVPPASPDADRLDVYPTTFYPSVTSVTNATFVAIAPGDERAGVNIQMRPVPTRRISGRLLGQTGPTALRLAAPGALAQQVATAVSDAEGRFTLLGVPPGQYVLNVLSPPSPGGGIRPASTPERPIQYAAQAITVANTEITDLVVSLRPLPRVAGRLEFQGATPARGASEVTTFALEPAEDGLSRASGFGTADNTFALGATPGKYNLVVTPPRSWSVKSARFDGREILDAPLELSSDADGIVVVLTDRPTVINGTVSDARTGAPDPNAIVLAFTTDQKAWTGNPGIRRMRSGRVTRSGAFTISDLAPGEYYTVAVAAEIVADWRDPKMLESLARAATRVTIGEGETRTVQLKTVSR
jgi:protocatechuate 3,4-dioxygenase beta subunit